MYEKILVAVDGSATSLRGLEEAIKVAKSTRGQLLLVHVVDELVIATDYVPTVYSAPIFEALRDSGAKILAQAATVVRRADLSCEQKLVETLSGRVADEIVKQAGEWRGSAPSCRRFGRSSPREANSSSRPVGSAPRPGVIS